MIFPVTRGVRGTFEENMAQAMMLCTRCLNEGPPKTETRGSFLDRARLVVVVLRPGAHLLHLETHDEEDGLRELRSGGPHSAELAASEAAQEHCRFIG